MRNSPFRRILCNIKHNGIHSPIEDAPVTSGSNKLAKLPSIWSLIVLLFRFNVHFKSPTDKSPTHCTRTVLVGKFYSKSRSFCYDVLFFTLRTHPVEKDFVKFVKSKRKSMEMIASVQTALCPLRCHSMYVLVVYRSVTFRRFSRHVVAYETLSAWSSREREPTRLVCL